MTLPLRNACRQMKRWSRRASNGIAETQATVNYDYIIGGSDSVFPYGENTFDLSIARCGSAFEPDAMSLKPRRGQRGKPPLLTLREIEVLTWVARGKSAWEIGEILDIAKRTVDEHAQSAVRKVGAVNRAHAVALAVRDRIISI